MTEAHSIDYNLIDLTQKGQADANFDFVATNPVNKEMDGIEILVSMAKTGKVNPWSIDIVSFR